MSRQLELPPAPERLQRPPAERVARIHPWRIALIAAAVLGAVFLGGYLPRHYRLKSIAQAARREVESLPVVNVVQVRRSPPFSDLLLPGNITPVTEAYIFARATGYVRRRYVDIGDRVRANQVLAEIEAPDLDAQVAQARATVSQTEQQLAQTQAALENSIAQEELSRVTWERYRVLVAHGAVSRQDADTQLANYRVAQANVRLQQAAVRTAEENVRAARAALEHLVALQEFLRVRAPFDGLITSRNFDVGAFINANGAPSGATTTPNGGTQITSATGNAGSTGNTTSPPSSGTSTLGPTATGAPVGSASEMFRIAQIGVLRVLINVPQESSPNVRRGLAAELFVQEFKHSFPGKVTRTSNSLDQTSRTLLTEVQAANPRGELLPGMYVQVQFTGRRSNPPLLVPGAAVMATSNGLRVAILENLRPEDRRSVEQHADAARRIHMVYVQVGRDYGTVIEVTHGLQGWEYVVVNPGDISEGSLVLPQAAPAIAGEGLPERRAPSERVPSGIGSPSMTAPTGGRSTRGGGGTQ
jgi:multidrug efflux pump subunit AcrA (membrane-fusion protein)